MRTHDLKVWPEHFEAIGVGAKRFEIRANDRDYHVGDKLILREWDPTKGEYTGKADQARVSYLLEGMGLKDGYVALGLYQVKPANRRDLRRLAEEEGEC